jgi:hypothetical protein
MTRILLIETASPKRICEKARQILSTGVYPNPEISILCNEKTSHAYGSLAGVKIYALSEQSKYLQTVEQGLARSNFDLAFAFWTGEKQYRWWKLLGLRLWVKEKYILSGDGNEFRLTWKAIIRHMLFRRKHRLPTDHWDYVTRETEAESEAEAFRPEGEKVLLIQSAEPVYLLESLDRLKPLFVNPIYTVFCRNHPETVRHLRGHPMLSRIITHSETRGSWQHLRALRRQHFHTIVLFLTGNPSYRKVKLFAFLLGGRRILIFNEFCDCFFFNWSQFLALISSRFQGQPRPALNSKWSQSTRILVSLILKSVLFPFRFLWLLLVWFRLRIAGWRSSRNCHDCSL